MDAPIHAIARLLQPRSVAIIGASADPTKTAGRPVAYLQKHGYAGQILPVNPKADRIGDLLCYADIASLPETPDRTCATNFTPPTSTASGPAALPPIATSRRNCATSFISARRSSNSALTRSTISDAGAFSTAATSASR